MVLPIQKIKMKRIFILAGAVLFIVLVIMCWFFLGNVFKFASNLGEESKIVMDDKNRFVGTWETTYIEGDDRFVGFNGIYNFKTDGTGAIGGLICTWNIENGKLVIDYNEGFSTLTYNYSFSNEDNALTLTNSNGSLEFIKK